MNREQLSAHFYDNRMKYALVIAASCCWPFYKIRNQRIFDQILTASEKSETIRGTDCAVILYSKDLFDSINSNHRWQNLISVLPREYSRRLVFSLSGQNAELLHKKAIIELKRKHGFTPIIKEISHINDLYLFCRQIKNNGNRIKFLMLTAHGHPNHININGSQLFSNDLDLKLLIRNMEDGSVIVLQSCSTGKETEIYSFARKLSALNPRVTVVAPSDDITGATLEFKNNQDVLTPSVLFYDRLSGKEIDSHFFSAGNLIMTTQKK